MRGALDRGRIRLGGKVVELGSSVTAGLVDLGLAIAPEIGGTSRATRRGVLYGLTVIVLLVLGLTIGAALIVEGGALVVEMLLPHRETDHAG